MLFPVPELAHASIPHVAHPVCGVPSVPPGPPAWQFFGRAVQEHLLVEQTHAPVVPEPEHAAPVAPHSDVGGGVVGTGVGGTAAIAVTTTAKTSVTSSFIVFVDNLPHDCKYMISN